MENDDTQQSLGIKAARKLATTTKTIPQMESISPRWFCMLLPWVNVVAGTFRVNKRRMTLKRDERIDIDGGEVRLEPRHLRAISLLRDAKESLVTSLLSCLVKEEYNSGDTLINEGGPDDKFFIITRGKVEISATNPSGKKYTLKIIAAGEYFGEIAAEEKEKKKSDVTVRALAPCLILTLNRTPFRKRLKDSKELRDELNRLIAERQEALSHVNEYGEAEIKMKAGHVGEPVIPETFVDYTETPAEYPLSLVQSILRVHTRISELYSSPMDQIKEELRLTVLEMKERKEWELINNPEFGLLNSVDPSMRVQTRGGPPTPDDMDELLTKVWKKPAFFLAHPRAVAAFGRECTRRGVPPQTTMILGSPFLTWRGVPILPCDKLGITNRSRYGHPALSTNILLMRVGEKDQGVIGLRNDALNSDFGHSLSVRFMGIDERAIASYLLSMYFSIAALTNDALGALENVDVGYYHEY